VQVPTIALHGAKGVQGARELLALLKLLQHLLLGDFRRGDGGWPCDPGRRHRFTRATLPDRRAGALRAGAVSLLEQLW